MQWPANTLLAGLFIFQDPQSSAKKCIFFYLPVIRALLTSTFNTSHLIKDSDSSWYIRKPRQKTGQESIIPLLPAAIRILEKYSAKKNIANFRWFVSTNQKMNWGLKYIGKRAGISKELHMHLVRHTFATTVTLGNGVPIETVSKMLGHANIKQTQHYAKVVPMKIKNDMGK